MSSSLASYSPNAPCKHALCEMPLCTRANEGARIWRWDLPWRRWIPPMRKRDQADTPARLPPVGLLPQRETLRRSPKSPNHHGVDQRLPRKSAPRPANIPKPRNVTLGGGKLVPNVDAEQDAKASPTLETAKAPLAAKSTSTSPASSRPPSGRNISSARKFERHIRTPSEVPIVAVGRPASSHTSRPSVDVPSLRDPIRGILNRRAAQPEPFRRCEDAASGDLRHPRFGGKLVSKSKSQQNNRGDVDLQRGSQSERPANVWDDFADVCGWETDQVVSDMF